MPDHFTEVTRTGYGKRVGNSLGGIVVGVVLFFASFGVLFTNEGAVDFSVIAKTAVQIDSSQAVVDPALKDKLLVTSGALTTTETLGDDLYLKPDKFIAIERKTEMYAWVEKKSEHSQTETGGSETTTTTYDYVKEWTSSPASSSGFRYPEGHQNMALDLKGMTKRVNNATIGVFSVDMQNVTMPSLSGLTLNAENTTLTPAAAEAQPATTAVQPVGAAVQPATTAATLEGGEFIYLSKTAGSTYQAPAVGDVRVSYSGFKDGQNVTIFGKLNDKTFGTYLDPNNNKLYQIFTGTKEEAIASLHESYVFTKWVWRVVGFMMMWIGLTSLLAPLSVIMDFLPFLGGLSRNLIGAVCFVVALVLSSVTVLIAMLFHNVVALVVALVAVIAIVFMILKQKRSQSSATKLPPASAPPASTPTGPTS